MFKAICAIILIAIFVIYFVPAFNYMEKNVDKVDAYTQNYYKNNYKRSMF